MRTKNSLGAFAERYGVEKVQAGEDMLGKLMKGRLKQVGTPKRLHASSCIAGLAVMQKACSEKSVAGEPHSYAPGAVGLWLYTLDYAANCHTRSRHLRQRG
jgi:hypothetical protein